MKRPKWNAKVLYIIFALALIVGLTPVTVLAGHATIVIDGPCYAKEGETVTFTANTNPTADSVDWYVDGTFKETDIGTPFELTTMFPPNSAGTHTVSATGHWGNLAQSARRYIMIGVGLIPQLEYNIIGTDAQFCVPALYNGHVVQWRFESSNQLGTGWSVVSGGRPRDGMPGGPDNCVTVHGSGWGELVIYADTEQFMGPPPDYITIPATTLMAIKKWGKLYDTWLFGWDGYTYEPIYESGETQIWWDENNKEWVGSISLYDLVIGRFITDGGELSDVFADGADVEWWVMNANAPVDTLPSDIPAQWWQDANGWHPGLVNLIEDMQDDYPAKHVGFGNCDTKYAETVSGDAQIDGQMTGLTGVSLVACGEEAVKVVVVAKYPNGLHATEWPVSPEIIGWNFWTQEVEIVPQVRWVGEKIVLEKQFGTNYATQDVCFTLTSGSGTLEVIVPSPNYMPQTGMQDTVWTPVDSLGVARCILTSVDPNACVVSAALYDDESPYQIINQAKFLVYFLKFEGITLSNMQGERTGHNDGLWDPVVDSGMIQDAFPNDIWDPTKNWNNNEFVGKTLKIWKGEMEDDGSITFLGDLQIRQIVSNTADTIVVDKNWDNIPSNPAPYLQWYYQIVDPVWDPATDDLVQEQNVSQDTLLRARVKGWFMGDLKSTRDEIPLDTDGDGIDDIELPEGRWVLPDDWYRLGGGLLWAELHPRWDIMDQPNDNIMSVIDYDADGWKELGNYVEWTLNEDPTMLDKPGDLVAERRVIGPYSTLDTYNPEIQEPQKLDRKTIVPNGKLNWWDCPMPPAKIIFEITEGAGFFKEVDKGDVYYAWVNTRFENPPEADGVAYTNPFYSEMIPASQYIPPFTMDCAYDWDSFGFNGATAYGPYPFWQIINKLPGMTPSNAQHPTKVEVYSDNHGEAMVWLNGDWNLDLSAWVSDGAFDIPPGMIVGGTAVMAIADYPYCRADLPIVSNNVEKYWTWGKQILGADLHEYNYGIWDSFDSRMVFQVGSLDPVTGKSDKKMAFIWVCDRDGFPAVGEKIQWYIDKPSANIPPIWTNGNGVSIYLPDDINVEDGILEGTTVSPTGEVGGVALDRVHAVSFTRLPKDGEKDVFRKFYPDLDPDDYAVAAIEVLSSNLIDYDLTIYVNDPREGTMIRHTNLDFNVADDPDDPLMLGDANGDKLVNAGDITKIKREYFGLDPWTADADANRDGLVDTGDITKVKGIYFGM